MSLKAPLPLKSEPNHNLTAKITARLYVPFSTFSKATYQPQKEFSWKSRINLTIVQNVSIHERLYVRYE